MLDQGTGNGAHGRGSSARGYGYCGSGGKGRKDEVKVNGPSPPIFIKLVGNRRASGMISI